MNATRRADGRFVSVTLPSRIDSVRPAAAFLVQTAKELKVAAAADSVFELAIVEALNNAVTHGHGGPSSVILCELEVSDRALTVRVLDQGPSYDLPPLPRPDSDAGDMAAIRESGYGLSIIRTVFPNTRTISRPGTFGIEMSLDL